MDGYAANPDLMRYLQGEISFETWLEQQAHRNDSNETRGHQPTTTVSSMIPQMTTATDEPASVFSSWGDAFTSSLGDGEGNQDELQPGHLVGQSQLTSAQLGIDEESDFEDEDAEETEEEILQLGKRNYTVKDNVRI